MAYPPNRPPQLQSRASMQQGAPVPPRAFSGRGSVADRIAAAKINQLRPPDLRQVRPMQAPQQGTGIPQDMPVFVPEQGTPRLPPEKKVSLYDTFKEGQIGQLAAASLAEKAISPRLIEDAKQAEEMKENQRRDSLQEMAMNNRAMLALRQASMNPQRALEEGGLIGMASGGEFAGRVPGTGHGMEDNVKMPIKEDGKQVATLAVSPSEYVVDSHTMAALGNGNADRGADVMDSAVKQIRQKAYGTEKQPKEISGLAALKPLIERV